MMQAAAYSLGSLSTFPWCSTMPWAPGCRVDDWKSGPPGWCPPEFATCDGGPGRGPSRRGGSASVTLPFPQPSTTQTPAGQSRGGAPGASGAPSLRSATWSEKLFDVAPSGVPALAVIGLLLVAGGWVAYEVAA